MATTLNRCNLPAWILASREYNAHPIPIVIQGATTADDRFFRQLDATPEQPKRARIFEEYMTVKFYLDEWRELSDGAQRSIKNSYVRFIRGWGVDSNAPEGAVLKAWVESRFGLAPTFHKVPLRQARDDDYSPYDIDRTRGMARTSSIYGQFDLLYAYCQYELARRFQAPDAVRLYRGIYDAHEHEVTERLDRRHYFVRLNNLSSFTSDVERAWEFGTTVWSVLVPSTKVFYFADLLGSVHLKGESEYLVLGGEYRVEEVWG